MTLVEKLRALWSLRSLAYTTSAAPSLPAPEPEETQP